MACRATSPSACTAVGGREDGTTLAERLERQPAGASSPPPTRSQGGATLSGVSVHVGVGVHRRPGAPTPFTPNARTLAERLETEPAGGIQPTPNPAARGGGFPGQRGLPPTSSGCAAVGSSNAGTLAEGMERDQLEHPGLPPPLPGPSLPS